MLSNFFNISNKCPEYLKAIFGFSVNTLIFKFSLTMFPVLIPIFGDQECPGMHLGCAIGQMAQKKFHGRTFWKTVRPSWRTVFLSDALFENGCARLFTCSLYFLKYCFPCTWSFSFLSI